MPVLDGARASLADGFVPGGSLRNLEWVRPHLDSAVSEDDLVVLADAQTSGGLLVAGELPGHPVIGHLVPRAGVETSIIGALSRHRWCGQGAGVRRPTVMAGAPTGVGTVVTSTRPASPSSVCACSLLSGVPP